MVLLFQISVVLYIVSTALGLAYLTSRDEELAVWKFRLLGLGVALHTLSIAAMLKGFWIFPENRFYFPIHSFFGALSWLAYTNAAIFLLIEAFARLRILGAFVLPWSCLAGAAALFARPELGPVGENLRSFRLNLHPMLLMFAYTAFANAFGVGWALLIQESQIKSRKPTELCYRLPPIEELDQLHFQIIAWFFPVLTAGLFMGSLWASTAWTGWISDAKVLATILTWLIYSGYLYMRGFGGYRGRKPIYVAQTGFISIIFAFFIVNYLSAQHGFLYGR